MRPSPSWALLVDDIVDTEDKRERQLLEKVRALIRDEPELLRPDKPAR